MLRLGIELRQHRHGRQLLADLLAQCLPPVYHNRAVGFFPHFKINGGIAAVVKTPLAELFDQLGSLVAA